MYHERNRGGNRKIKDVSHDNMLPHIGQTLLTTTRI